MEGRRTERQTEEERRQRGRDVRRARKRLKSRRVAEWLVDRRRDK